MFSFFGAFADRAPNIAEEFARRWPDVDIVKMETPFRGLGVRFQESVYTPEDEDLPEPVSLAVQDISRQNPTVRFILLRTECWGGVCGNWGQFIVDGNIAAEELVVQHPNGEGTLRRLIGHLGVDIGKQERFEALDRRFPWKGSGTNNSEQS
ncbi:MAG TPA: hypothetical protein VJP02_18790 [Candidatus Sulfotelmatobacter sp.]|nr:hypothetical protein [Candidatus Sulfotelmatobacter sp.]